MWPCNHALKPFISLTFVPGKNFRLAGFGVSWVWMNMDLLCCCCWGNPGVLDSSGDDWGVARRWRGDQVWPDGVTRSGDQAGVDVDIWRGWRETRLKKYFLKNIYNTSMFDDFTGKNVMDNTSKNRVRSRFVWKMYFCLQRQVKYFHWNIWLATSTNLFFEIFSF